MELHKIILLVLASLQLLVFTGFCVVSYRYAYGDADAGKTCFANIHNSENKAFAERSIGLKNITNVFNSYFVYFFIISSIFVLSAVVQAVVVMLKQHQVMYLFQIVPLVLLLAWDIGATKARFEHTGQVCGGDFFRKTHPDKNAILFEQGKFMKVLISFSTFFLFVLPVIFIVAFFILYKYSRETVVRPVLGERSLTWVEGKVNKLRGYNS